MSENNPHSYSLPKMRDDLQGLRREVNALKTTVDKLDKSVKAFEANDTIEVNSSDIDDWLRNNILNTLREIQNALRTSDATKTP